MAERRMFAKTIIDSDAFLDMPLSTQALYFHLSMRADDEGFVNNPKKIARMIGADDDSLKLLIMKKFILPFESGVVVIKHWRIHNYIQKDRFKETVYKDERRQLTVKENGAYTQNPDADMKLIDAPEKTLRQTAYEESELPYSFDYKIRQAFVGKKCPICNCTMSYANNLVSPTIQHNTPLSKGGKHELGNISVICRSCNTSIQDTETGTLNAEEVVNEWEKISCTRFVHEMDTQVRLGKDRLGKDKEGASDKPKPRSAFVKPTVEEVAAYCAERNNGINAQAFIDFYESKGWMIGKQKMKDWKAAVRTWENRRKAEQPKGGNMYAGIDADCCF